MIFYLAVENNKRSLTVLRHFRDAVLEYGCPLRVRGDCGTENRMAAKFMFLARGVGDGSYKDQPYLAGKSTSNQRIERLWREVKEKSYNSIRLKRIEMINSFEIDQDSCEHDFIWHYLVDNLNEYRISEFIKGHRNHKMRLEENKTPLQLYQVERKDQFPPPAPFLHTALHWAAVQLGEIEDPAIEVEQSDEERELNCPFATWEEFQEFHVHTGPIQVGEKLNEINERYANALQLMTEIVGRREEEDDEEVEEEEGMDM